MVQLDRSHRVIISLFILTFISLLLFDRRIKIDGENITKFSHTKFKKVYRVEYKNPLKAIFTPKVSSDILIENNDILLKIKENEISVSGTGLPGGFSFNISVNGRDYIRTITFNENREDSDKDGFFDLVELYTEEDRDSFVNWFTSIAKSQYYNLNRGWDNIHRDCSGLITFAYREALKIHDLNWLKGFSTLDEQRDVEKYNYPNIPILGVNCFNTASGFKPGANASALLNYNMGFISRDPKELKKGDILFYYDNEYEMPYHSMIYLGEPGYVVYHTGPIDDKNSGEVRMVLISDLLKHPDQKWHPAEYNTKFLGGYRWHILM